MNYVGGAKRINGLRFNSLRLAETYGADAMRKAARKEAHSLAARCHAQLFSDPMPHQWNAARMPMSMGRDRASISKSRLTVENVFRRCSLIFS